MSAGDGSAGSSGGAPVGHGPLEVELKYDVLDRAAVQPLLDAPALAGLAAGPWRETDVEDRYVDTPGRALERLGYAARIRRRGRRTTVDLKSLTPADGALHRREEVEGPAGDGLDPHAWPSSDARELLLRALGSEPLEERFRIRQRRMARDLRGADGAAELSLDDVEVLHGDEQLGRLTVLEVELRGGDETLLSGIATALEASGAVRASARSKFEVAGELLAHGQAASTDPTATQAIAPPPTPAPGASPGPEPAPAPAQAPGPAGDVTPVAATARTAPASPPTAAERLIRAVGKTPGVVADDLFAEAGRKVIRFHLARMLAAEAGTRSSRDPEDLHKMRVATRRMRAAWRVFGAGFRRGRVRRSVGALRTLAGHLGTVRDLDVLLDGLAAHAATLDDAARPALEPLADAWRAQRHQAQVALVHYLDSGAYRRFVDDQLGFVETPGQDVIPAGPTDPRRVRDTAPSRLWAAYERVRAYDGVLPWADLATLHQLRIAGKRLRYALEFFREPLGPDTALLIERITALQDHLGLLHDADVAAGLARSFLVEHATTLTPAAVEAVGRYLADRERETARLRRTMGPIWRRITSVEFRRALGRAVAQL